MKRAGSLFAVLTFLLIVYEYAGTTVTYQAEHIHMTIESRGNEADIGQAGGVEYHKTCNKYPLDNRYLHSDLLTKNNPVGNPAGIWVCDDRTIDMKEDPVRKRISVLFIIRMALCLG